MLKFVLLGLIFHAAVCFCIIKLCINVDLALHYLETKFGGGHLPRRIHTLCIDCHFRRGSGLLFVNSIMYWLM